MDIYLVFTSRSFEGQSDGRCGTSAYNILHEIRTLCKGRVLGNKTCTEMGFKVAASSYIELPASTRSILIYEYLDIHLWYIEFSGAP